MSSWIVMVIALVAVLVLVLALRRPVQDGLFAGTGLDRWRGTASRLTWRDRLVISWTTTRGQASPRRLAPLAVERGEAVLSMIERTRTRGSTFRRIWWALGGFWVVLLLANVVMLVTSGGSRGTWLNLLTAALGLGVAYLSLGPWQARRARLIRRSVEANREQLPQET